MIGSQAMEDHRVRQARIVEALEAEKRKISKELEEMQKKRALRENQTPPNGEFPSCYSAHFEATMTIPNRLVQVQMDSPVEAKNMSYTGSEMLIALIGGQRPQKTFLLHGGCSAVTEFKTHLYDHTVKTESPKSLPSQCSSAFL